MKPRYRRTPQDQDVRGASASGHRAGRLFVLVRDILYISFGKYGQYLVTLITVPLTARVLGVEGIGMLAIGTSAYFFGSVIVDFGLTNVLAVRVALTNDIGALRASYAILRAGLLTLIVAAMAVTLLTCHIPSVRIAVIGVVAGGLSSVGEDWIFIGQMAYGIFAVFQGLGRVLYLAAVVVGIFVWPSPTTVLIALSMSTTFSAALGWVWARRFPIQRTSVSEIRLLARSAASAFASRLILTSYGQGASLLYSSVVPAGVLGIYSAGDKILRAAQSAMDAVSIAALPRLSKLTKTNEGFWQSTVRGIVAVFTCGAIGAAVLWALAPVVISLIYGPLFVHTVPVFRIEVFILPAVAVSSLVTSAVLYSRGDTRGVLYASLVGLCVTGGAVALAGAFPFSVTLALGSVASEWLVMIFVLSRMRVIWKRSLKQAPTKGEVRVWVS